MASLSRIEAEINSLPSEWRPVFLRIFRAFLADLRLGHPSGTANDPCANFGAKFIAGTTSAVSGDEFAIAHALGRAPYLLLPVLPLDQVGAQIVPLTVTRAPDAHRVFLSSTVEDAPITVVVEG